MGLVRLGAPDGEDGVECTLLRRGAHRLGNARLCPPYSEPAVHSVGSLSASVRLVVAENGLSGGPGWLQRRRRWRGKRHLPLEGGDTGSVPQLRAVGAYRRFNVMEALRARERQVWQPKPTHRIVGV
jgi:hypothetical protein